ncbi:hypothetical protein AAVH_21030 [Aphelenchoides avenae]|nr:hypothetical protein AAVH_21030 [Aphelenchus avenae]
MSKKSQKGCKVFLIEHSITRLKVAAIVDFEQTGDLTGGMLHDLIHKAGGPQLEAECREKTYPKLLNTGEAVLTGAHGIRDVQGIIHTVYPILVDGLSKYEAKALVECHDNALRIACGIRMLTLRGAE